MDGVMDKQVENEVNKVDEEEKYFFERQTVFLTETFNISTTTTTWTQTWRSPTTLACTWRRTTTWTLRGGGTVNR